MDQPCALFNRVLIKKQNLQLKPLTPHSKFANITLLQLKVNKKEESGAMPNS